MTKGKAEHGKPQLTDIVQQETVQKKLSNDFLMSEILQSKKEGMPICHYTASFNFQPKRFYLISDTLKNCKGREIRSLQLFANDGVPAANCLINVYCLLIKSALYLLYQSWDFFLNERMKRHLKQLW